MYDRDLPKICSGDNMNVHYNGEAQIAIGARFAYANAVEHGWDVTEGGTISVRSQLFTGAENYPATNVYAATPSVTVHLNDDAAWWDGNAANKANVIAVWDISSANQQDTISADFAVGGIRVEDPVVHTVTINNASGSHTLSVGGSGIELQKGNLTVNTALATTADQTWTLAGERKLNITGGISGDHAVSIVRGGESTKSGQVSVTFGATDSHSWSVGSGVEFNVLGGDAVTIDSLALTSGATLNIGGKSALDLTINALTATGGTFAFNMASADSYDHLTLGNGSSLSGDFLFNITVNKKVASTSYTLVENWTGGSNFTGNIECAKGVSGTLAQVGNSLVLTLTGTADGTADYINHAWPSVATTTQVPGNGGDFYAGDHGDSTHYAYREDQGANALRFYASKSSGSGDTYAELTDTPCNWLSAFGSGSSSSAITVDGSASLKHSGTRATSHTVYGGVNGTLSGDAYLELADANSTYTVNGLYNAHVGGKLTYILNGGTYSSFTAGVTNTTSSTVGKGVYVQIEDGTFNGAVYGGSTVAATIDGGVHLVVNGGTFNGDFLAGNNGGGIINDGVEVIINGGTFKSWVFGAGYGGTINGDIHMTISGGNFQKDNSIYAGGGSSGTTVTGNSTITLKDIANGNEFLSYTGILSGGHQNGSAAGLGNGTTRTLELDNYTADGINATLTSFTEISAINGTNTALPGTANRGGATSVSVDETSTLKMAVEQANMGTLHGEGRIEITGTGGNASTAFTFGEDWAGTVAMQGMTVGGVYNFNRFGQAGSTIEVNGLGVGSGQRYIENGTYAADFVLNKGYLNMDYGMYLTDGFSSGYVNFTGKWSGDGDFYYTPGATQHFAFLGDMSEYSGKFLVKNSATLDFGDNHAGVTGKSVSGLGEIKGEHATSFTEVRYSYSNDVSAYNKITGSINLTQRGSGVLTLTNANDYTGTTTVESGTLKLESLGRTGTGNVIVKSGASLEQENFKLTGGTADSTIVLLEGQGLGATSSDFQSMTLGSGSTLKMTGAISLASFTTGAGYQGTGNGTVTLSGDSAIGTADGTQSASSHHYVLTGGTSTFSNVDLTATGNAIAVDAQNVGLNLAGTVNVSGNISVGQYNRATIADGAQVKAGSIVYATGQQAWSGGVSIGANALLELTDKHTYSRVDSLTNAGTMHLNGAELRLHARSANGTYNVGNVEVTGNAAITTDWFNATTNITSLTGHGESTLTLCNDVCVTTTNTFALGTEGKANSTSAFSGTIALVAGAQYTGVTSTNLLIKEENIAANALLKLTSTSNHANTMSVTLGADKVNVAGVETAFTHGEAPTITSVSGTNTLGLTGSGDYTANVALRNLNIDKTGSGNQTFSGSLTNVGDINVAAGTLTLSCDTTGVTGGVSIANGAALVVGAETVKALGSAEIAEISGSGAISVTTATRVYTNADITVDTTEKFESAATLNNSKLTVIGGGSVKVALDENSTNDLDASQGSVEVDTGTATAATIGTLTLTSKEESVPGEVQIRKVEVRTSFNELADVSLTGTDSRMDSGNTLVAKEVTVESGAELTVADNAQISGEEGSATSSGNLVVSSGGTLAIETTSAVTTQGSITFETGSQVRLDKLVVADPMDTIVLATSQGGIQAPENFEGVKILMGDLGAKFAGAVLAVQSSVPQPLTMPLSLSGDGEVGDPESLTVTLTSNRVTSVDSVTVDGDVFTVALQTNITQEQIDGITSATELFVLVDYGTAGACLSALADKGWTEGKNVSIVLNSTDNTVLDFSASSIVQVSFNGYTGTNGADGAASWVGNIGQAYDPALIPEPTTATLSLLALAALAARRRRKA